MVGVSEPQGHKPGDAAPAEAAADAPIAHPLHQALSVRDFRLLPGAQRGRSPTARPHRITRRPRQDDPTHPPEEGATMTPAVEQLGLTVSNLTKSYAGTEVVHDLTFNVRPGRITGFLGPNGSGKSTTMKMLLDLATRRSGQRRTIGGVRYRDLT